MSEFCRIAPNVKLGENVSIYGFVNLYGCSIGDNSRVGAFVEIQKNARIGRNVKVSSHTFICEGVTIEDDVFVGHNVSFINDKYPRATNEGGAPQSEADWQVVKDAREAWSIHRHQCDDPLRNYDRRECGGRRRQRGHPRCPRQCDRGREPSTADAKARSGLGSGLTVRLTLPPSSPRCSISAPPWIPSEFLSCPTHKQQRLTDSRSEGDIWSAGDPPDPSWERDFANWLRESNSRDELHSLFGRFRMGDSSFDAFMRRVLLRAMCRAAGHDLQVGVGVVLKHPETMEFGDCVFIGSQVMIQGRFDGTCRIGNHVWIGPQAYFDARQLTLEDYVGWGPGAKVLGSAHTGGPDRRADHNNWTCDQAGRCGDRCGHWDECFDSSRSTSRCTTRSWVPGRW